MTSKDFKLPDDPRERELLKERIIEAAKENLTLGQIVEKLELRPLHGGNSRDIDALRKQDFEFARRLRDAMWGRPEDGPFVRQRYGVKLSEGNLNRFLVEYAEHGSRSKACFNSGMRPHTLMNLTDPTSDDFHAEFARCVEEEELYQLLSIEDDLLIKARGGDAVSQRFVLDRRVDRYKTKRSEEASVNNVWSLEALSNAADTLVSLARRARGPEEKEEKLEAAGEVPEPEEGSSKDAN